MIKGQFGIAFQSSKKDFKKYVSNENLWQKAVSYNLSIYF